MKKIYLIILMICLFSCISSILFAEDTEEYRAYNYGIYFRLGMDIGLGNKLIATTPDTTEYVNGSPGKDYTLYKAKNSNGISLDAGAMINVGNLIKGGVAGSFRYLLGNDSDVRLIGLMMDTTFIKYIQFYLGGAYVSYSSSMPSVIGWNMSNPVMGKNSLSGLGLLIGGGLNFPLTQKFGLYLYYEYLLMNAPGDKGSVYAKYNWRSHSLRTGVSYQIDFK